MSHIYRYDEPPILYDIETVNMCRSTWSYVYNAFYIYFCMMYHCPVLIICLATLTPPGTFLYTLLIEYLEAIPPVSIESFTAQLVIGYDCMTSIWIAVTTKPIWGQY